MIIAVDTEERLATGPSALVAAVSAPVDVAPDPGALEGSRRFPPPVLRVRPYRWYWIAQWPVLVGTWMQVVALGFLVYQVTGSTTAVAVVAGAQGLPAFVLPILGGALADRLPRRRILLVTQSTLGVSAGTLAVLAASGHAGFAAIALVAFVFGSADAIDLPTRQALVADLVQRDLIVSAVALTSMAMSASRIIGPSLAGLLIAVVGPGICFGVLSLAYLAPLLVLLLVIPDLPPAGRGEGSALAAAWRGLGDAAHDPLVRRIVTCAATLSFLGVAYMPFLPVLARQQLGGDSRVLGLLYTTGGVGGLLAGLIVASMGRGAGRVRLLLAGGPIYAAGLFTLAHSHHLALALPALVAISFGFVALNTSMTTMLQTETPARLRGRMLGVYVMVMAGLQPLGTLFYGLISTVVPLFTAVGIGGVAVGVVAVLTARSRPVSAVDARAASAG
jgi:MFS family permease